ncbi:MAG TPA: serine/threonine-protein kinase [Verrucomicrobiae bacterium]|nr:serine/threonine-protein kinase [Verrucomicrobiae bacterium]
MKPDRSQLKNFGRLNQSRPEGMTKTAQQVEALFDAARQLTSPAARQTFLDEACAGDATLRARVEALLSAQSDADKFFSEIAPFASTPRPGAGDSAAGPGSSGTETRAEGATPMEGPGTRIDRYKLLQKIGEGGCGVVYMAEQEKPVLRRVAFKIIKLGMDTKNVIARFGAERQALAMMDHPNIARVLDAGATETGRPYFVMELVRGVKITDYCDQNHLDTRQRLDLFVQICHAIQHAHQKGIIHRDIKPSNILVTLHDGVPVPKVIDFGIAKAIEGKLTDQTLFTAYEQIIGTPAYMSPEQAEMSGLDIDTRTDIYSLGVLLYELLTGRTPFDAKMLMQSGLDEMRRTLREKEPQRPSTMLTTLQHTELTATAVQRHAEPPKLVTLLQGDLDWIVMKCLDKDRRRRYETANGLAMDVQRYLNNEPVIARPPSRLYRFQKLVRRNKILFASGTAVTAALLIGLGMATWLFFMERAARREAVAAEEQQYLLRQEAERARANEAELRRQAEIREKLTLADVRISQNAFDEADNLLNGYAPTQPSLEGARVFRAVGEWHALQGRWREAANRFGVLMQINKFDGWDMASLDYLRLGPALVELGDVEGYERFRQEAIARFAGTPYPVAAERVVKISLLRPADPKTMDALAPLVALAAKSFDNVPPDNTNAEAVFQAAWGSISVALMEYRRGNYARAEEWCRHCLAYPGDNPPRVATARVILAMSCHQLGQNQEATTQLAEGRESIEAKFDDDLDPGSAEHGFWFDWVFARILSHEATALIGLAPQASHPPPV